MLVSVPYRVFLFFLLLQLLAAILLVYLSRYITIHARAVESFLPALRPLLALLV